MSSQVVRVIADIFSFFLVFLPCILLEFFATPYRRGFFCNDESIKYPFKEDTVTDTALVIFGVLAPFFLFLLIEGAHVYKSLNSQNISLSFALRTNVFPWRLFTSAVYAVYGVFLFGLAVEQTLTDIGKFSTGRLRPHFLAVCRPDMTRLNCTVSDGALTMSAYVSVEDESCRLQNAYNLRNARLSFPSGHSSLAAYVGTFIVIYLQMRLTWSGSRLLRHCAQAVTVYLAVFVCLSRISDYKHHSSDVFAGACVGVLVASLVGIHIYYKMHKHSLLGSLHEDFSTNRCDLESSRPSSSSMTTIDISGTHALIEEI